jgi:hypothetical protein
MVLLMAFDFMLQASSSGSHRLFALLFLITPIVHNGFRHTCATCGTVEREGAVLAAVVRDATDKGAAKVP